MDYAKLAVEGVALLVGGLSAWYALRSKVEETRNAALEANRVSAAAHRRADDHEKRLIGLEKGQEYHERRLEESLREIRDTLKEVREVVDRMAERGIHCSHCHEGGR